MGIQKLSNNQWLLDVRVWVNRKEIRKRKRFCGGKKDAIAEIVLMRVKLKKEGENNTRSQCKKFADILRFYEEKRGNVPRQQRTLLCRLVRDLGKVPLLNFADRFDRYLSILRNCPSKQTLKPLSNATINRLVAMTRAAFNVALYMEKIGKNPITPRRFPKLTEIPRDRILSYDEKLRLLNVLEQKFPHLVPIVKYALQVPLRKNELVKMKKEDLNLFSGAIRVHNGTTKSGMGLWKPIPPDMIEYFVNLPPECPYLFYRCDKGEYKPLGDFKRTWGRAKDLAGISDYRFHDTRHQAATELINNGTPEQIVNEISGWSPKSNMLTRYYNYAGMSSLKFIKFENQTGHLNRTVESKGSVSL